MLVAVHLRGGAGYAWSVFAQQSGAVTNTIYFCTNVNLDGAVWSAQRTVLAHCLKAIPGMNVVVHRDGRPRTCSPGNLKLFAVNLGSVDCPWWAGNRGGKGNAAMWIEAKCAEYAHGYNTGS